MGRGRQLLYTVAAALALSSCASKKTVADKAPMVETLNSKTPAKMTAKWKDGECIFDREKMTIAYTNTKEKISKETVLDVRDNEVTKDIELKPVDMLCSGDFTVVVGEEYVLVAQGADDILSGFPMLGLRVDGKIEVTNSYYIDIRKIKNENIESVFIADSKLIFVTEKKVWEIDLLDNPNVTSTER